MGNWYMSGREVKGYVTTPQGVDVPVWQIDKVMPVSAKASEPDSTPGMARGYHFYIRHVSGEMTLFHFALPEWDVEKGNTLEYHKAYEERERSIARQTCDARNEVMWEISNHARCGKNAD